jgi:hypothetical protein
VVPDVASSAVSTLDSEMASLKFVVPDAVIRMILEEHGEAGRIWLSTLPNIVEQLAVRWSLRVSRAFEGGR